MIRLLAILFLIPVLSFSTDLDSLLKITESDVKQEKIEAYLDLSELYLLKDSKAATKYAQKAVRLAQEADLDSLSCIANIKLAVSYHSRDDLVVAANLLTQVIEKISIESHPNAYLMANNQLAVVYGKWGKFDTAMEYLQEAERARDLATDSAAIVSLDNNIGNVMLRANEIESAQIQFRKVIKAAKQIDNQRLYKSGMTNLAQSYAMAGKLDTAGILMQHNLSTFEDNTNFDLTVDYMNYALLLFRKGNIDSSDYYHNLAIASTYKNNELKNRLQIRLNMHQMHSFQHLPKDQTESDLLAIVDTAETEGFIELEAYARMQLVNFFELTEQKDKYVDAITKFYEVKDSIGYLRTQKEIAALQLDLKHKNYQNKLAIKDLELKKQKLKENYFWFGLLFVFLFGLAVTLLLFNNKRMIKKLEKQNRDIEEKNRLLEENNRQMNIQKYQIESMMDDIKASKERLEIMNRQKDTFMSVFTHQLTNQVQAVLMSAEALYLGKNKSKDLIDRFSEILYNASNHLRNMLTNLMEWSRTQTEYVQTNPVHFELQEIINRNLSAQKHLINKKNIEIVKACREQIVFADKAMIDTVFKNVISNAIKYSHEGGSIEFSCEMEENYIISTIKDYGIGIPADLMDKLFNIETRVATRGTFGEQGSGLGLSICKELLSLNNGKIEIDTEEGKGTLIKIHLPTIDIE